jgi:hypothetical protein
MPKNDPPLSFPVRGVRGGYVDWWQRDELAEETALRAAAERAERRVLTAATRIGKRWKRELERKWRDRERG